MISVCMATYNGASYIKQQIDSILVQLDRSDELIISDDGSTDDTIGIINDIADPRIRLLKGSFKKVQSNFENALRHASGDIIFLSDQDDVWFSTKIEKMVKYLKIYDLVISDSCVTDSNLNILYPSFFNFFKSGKGIVKNIIKSSYYGACMAFNRKILNYALPFPTTKEIGHDLWLGLVGEIVGKVIFLNEPLIFYRRHNNAFCKTGIGTSNRKLIEQITGRLIMIKELIIFFYKIYAKRTGVNNNTNV